MEHVCWADSGIILEVLPLALTTWADWVAAHPDTTVLDQNTGLYPADFYAPESEVGSAYYDYRQRESTMFPVPPRSDLLPTKSRVLGINLNGQARAYPTKVLEREAVINDSLGGSGLVVVTPDVGGGSRAYQRDGHRFVELGKGAAKSGAAFLLGEEGRRWVLGEDALARTDDPSVRLPRLPCRSSYWFGWYAFYPNTEVYVPEV